MILLVDIGNTRLKWATLQDDAFALGDAIDYRAVDFDRALQTAWEHLPKPSCVRVANVAGKSIAAQLEAWLQQRWLCAAEFVSATATAFGVTNAYAIPEQLGVDRWLAILAAREQFLDRALLLFSCGTCLTVDLITREGMHLGGLIGPGLELMQRSILQTIVEDRALSYVDGQLDIANDTQSAISNGSLTMAVAFIDYVRRTFSTRVGGEVCCVLTGGNAPHLLKALSGEYHCQPDLVLRGLARVAKVA